MTIYFQKWSHLTMKMTAKEMKYLGIRHNQIKSDTNPQTFHQFCLKFASNTYAKFAKLIFILSCKEARRPIGRPSALGADASSSNPTLSNIMELGWTRYVFTFWIFGFFVPNIMAEDYGAWRPHGSIVKILNLYVMLSCTHLYHFFPLSMSVYNWHGCEKNTYHFLAAT